MQYAVVQRRKLSLSDARWLVIGVLVNALVLAIPVELWTSDAAEQSARLMIRLLTPPRPRPAPPSDVPKPEPQSEPISSPTALAQPPSPEPIEDAPIRAIPPVEKDEPDPAVSAVRLMGLRDSVAERVPLHKAHDASAQALGTPRAYEVPENWRPGSGAEALAPFDNVFNGKTVPEDVEVVDRWLAADGSHNVVVETPAGLRLCGRARAWNPAQPLVEHIMQWKVCGGDFARPFEFTPRTPMNRDFIEPVAKDATEP